MANKQPKPYGILAKFENQEDLVAAARRAYDAGYRKFDAYTPYPVEELDHVMRMKPSLLTYFILLGGILGAVTAFIMEAGATVIWNPLNIGGRPLFSWPAYVPIIFELTVLFAATFGVIGLFVATRFPQPYHPVFNSEDFREHGSQDAFYLGIEASDPQYNPDRTRRFLQELGPVQVSELEA